MSKILEEAVEVAQKDEASAAAIASAETGQAFADANMPAQEAAPTLEYEEIPQQKTETAFHVKLVRKKSRKGGVIALAALIAVVGLGAAAYKFGFFGGGADGFSGLGVKNVTDPPSGVNVPSFSPIDPLEFIAASDDDFVVVPDETGLELPAFGHGPQVTPERQNHYTQTPNVSSFFTRAAQDESYVYFLQGPAATKYGLYKLMRANPSTGKAESVANANETESSIYSFALYGQNIITCEHNAATDTFAFYRVPKSDEDAQLLFETDSPAYMNVFDNKLFMLFVEEQRLGVFDFVSDTQPSYIDLKPLDNTAHYFPQFSVINGYLYCGVWHDTDTDSEADDDAQVSMEYLRRSLYTGETTTLLSCKSGDSIWNPCWDDDGNAYYAQHDSEAMNFALVAVKDGGSPQMVSSFDFGGDWPPIAFKDEFLVTAFPDEALRQYDRADFSVKLEVLAESQPFATTKDFLVADDGLYRLFDLGFVAFEQ